MRVLAVFAAAFAAGIGLAQYLLPTGWLLPCAAAALLLACGRLVLNGNAGRRLLLIGTGLALALGWNWLYVRQVAAPMEALAGEEGQVTLTLWDYAVPTAYGAKATVRAEGLPAKVVYYGDASLLDHAPGETVRAAVRFSSASRIREDDVTAFTARGVFLLAYGRGEAEYAPGSAASPRWWPVRLGHAVALRCGALLAGDAGAFLTAILTGDKSGLSVQASADLQEAGIYHILAVSGMHCTFLLSFITVLAGRHRRRLVASCAIPLLLFYVLLTGGSPSVVRACVMMIFLLLAPLLRRESDGPTALSAALFLILLANPFAAASVSLQLSFASMAGLLWLTPRLYRLLAGRGNRSRAVRTLSAALSSSLGALVFTAPLSALYFGSFSLVSPLSNLLCLWAAGIVFLGGLLAVSVSFLLWPLGHLLALVPGLLIRYILAAAHLLARLPYHAVYAADPYLKYWLVYVYLLLAAVCLLKTASRRRYALAAVLAAASLAPTIYLGQARYASAMDALVLDVGQGESVVLASGGQFALVDCGSGSSWYDAGALAAAQLRSMGCRRLDLLVLTHYDADHVNGVEALLSRLPVAAILAPNLPDDNGLQGKLLNSAARRGVPVLFPEAAERTALGRGTLTVFPPVGSGGDNETGLSVLASVGETDLLITGDMGQATERALLRAYDLPDLEALVAGHHGSRTSTSEDLLAALTPETVCISVGSNSYGHPSPEVLRRLSRHGCAVYRTDRQGSIHISMNP